VLYLLNYYILYHLFLLVLYYVYVCLAVLCFTSNRLQATVPAQSSRLYAYSLSGGPIYDYSQLASPAENRKETTWDLAPAGTFEELNMKCCIVP